MRKAISGWAINGRFKVLRTDNHTFDAINDLRIPTVDNLAEVLGLTKKQSFKRVNRLVAKGLIRKVRIKDKTYIHLV